MLSGDGDHPMTKLSDTQAVILSTASQRDDGAVLPLPETLKLTGGALTKVLGSLKAKGLIEHQGTPRGDDPPPLRITRAGLEAIGVEPEDTGSTPVPATDAPQGAPDAQEAAHGGSGAAGAGGAGTGRHGARSGQGQGQGEGGASLQSRPRLRRPTSPRPAPAPSRPR